MASLGIFYGDMAKAIDALGNAFRGTTLCTDLHQVMGVYHSHRSLVLVIQSVFDFIFGGQPPEAHSSLATW